MTKYKPFPKTRKFGKRRYHTPSFHTTKGSAEHIAKNYRKREGGSARVVKGKNILGETRYVVYRLGGTAETARKIARRK